MFSLCKTTSKSYGKRVRHTEKGKPHTEETNIRKVLRNFHGIPGGELKIHLYLNIKEKCNKQCMGGVLPHCAVLMWSLKRCVTSRCLIYSCTSTNPESYCTGHLIPVLALLSNGGPWAPAIQYGHKTMLRLFPLSSPLEISTLVRNLFCLWHSCFQFNSFLPCWTFLPCMPDHSSVKLPLPIITSPSLETDASRQGLPKIVHPIRSKIKSNTKISSLLECHLLD